MMTSGCSRAIAAATAASSDTSSESRPSATTSWRGSHSRRTAVPSWPRAPTTTTRISGCPLEHAFPASDDHGGHAVSHDVDGGTSHIHDLIDAEQDGCAFERQVELRQRRGQNDE